MLQCLLMSSLVSDFHGAFVGSSVCVNTEMDCQRMEDLGSKMLQRIADQLQCYRAPSLIEQEEENISNGHNIGFNFGIMDPVQSENQQFTTVNWRERRAAVLICVFEGHQGELRVILTKRSMKLSSHPENFIDPYEKLWTLKGFSLKEKGDVALPDGKMEKGDADDSATALREAMEEIGLDPRLVHVVANLEPFISQNQLRVVPVIGLLAKIEQFRPVLNTDEVDAVFYVPLEMKTVIDVKNRHGIIGSMFFHCFDFGMEQGTSHICGLTASILIRAASVIYQRMPCFTVDLPDFQQLQRALTRNAVRYLSFNQAENTDLH